jgi:mycothiol synthase
VTIRRTSPADLETVVALVTRANLADLGSPETSVQEMREDWGRAGYETWVADEAGRLVGYVYLFERSPGTVYIDAYVHPDARGRGTEEALVRTAEGRARERSVALANAFAVTPAMGDVLERQGYRLTRHHFQMTIDLDGPPPPPEWPPGVAVRTFVPGSDDAEVWELMNDAFRDEYGHVPDPLPRWRERLIETEMFDAGLWVLAHDDGALVGAALSYAYPDGGWVQGVGVRAAARRRGLGLALLRWTLAAFWERGVTAVALSVDADNPTGATRLYERAGMRVAFRVDRYEKRLAEESPEASF